VDHDRFSARFIAFIQLQVSRRWIDLSATPGQIVSQRKSDLAIENHPLKFIFSHQNLGFPIARLHDQIAKG
jgi:hypothetical protein